MSDPDLEPRYFEERELDQDHADLLKWSQVDWPAHVRITEEPPTVWGYKPEENR
ncbi:MAG: hypothetical protein ABW022_10365 [Actinoplanes sp.]